MPCEEGIMKHNHCGGSGIGILASLCLAMVVLMTAASAAAQDVPMHGKTVLITGSTDGMGRELALRLGAMGADVIVHGRNLERGNAVVEQIRSDGGRAWFYPADLASLDAVRSLADRVLTGHDALHLLINNAGIGSGVSSDGERPLSEDGHELIFQVNYLSHFLLTELLLPRMLESAPARIINVASAGQRPINFSDVMMSEHYNPGSAYTQSKLAQILHAFELAKRLENTGVNVYALHPATFMDTTLVREAGATPRSTVDEGADAVMNLAVSEEFAQHSGIYLNRKREARANAQAYDHEARRKLDRLSRELTGLDASAATE